MSKELIEIDVFDAGLNTKAEPINLLPGQSDYMNNILFGDYGSIRSRGGITTYNSTPFSAVPSPIDGMISYKPSTMSALLVVGNRGTGYVLTGASTFPVAISGATNFYGDGPLEMVQMNELLFLATPNITMKKFNGREFTNAGVVLPTQALTAVCDAAGGNLNGEYQYVYWGVNSYLAEGDYIETPSDVKTIASGKVRVSNIPTAPAAYGIETWKIGRNTAGAAGIYWYLTDVTNGVTSFTDNTADDVLDVLAPTAQGGPKTFTVTCVYGGRLWGATGDYLWYSNPDQPEEFPSTNFIRVGSGSGLNICSIVPFNGMIVISMSNYVPTINNSTYSQRTALYVLRIGDSIGFNDPENWYLNLVSENEGSESQHACIPVAGYLWMTGRKGVTLFNGASVLGGVMDTPSGGVVASKISDPIGSLFTLARPGNIRLACAIEWQNKVYLSIDRTNGDQNYYPSNDTTLIYDYTRVGSVDPRKGGWSKIDLYGAQQFVVHEDQLLGAGNNSSTLTTDFRGPYIYKWDNPTTTAYPIDLPTYRMAPIRGKKQHIYNDKDFRFINVWASGVGTLTVTVRVGGVDYDSATTVHTEALALVAAGSKSKISLTGQASGKILWIQFVGSSSPTSNSLIDLSITRVQVFYNLRGLRNA